MPQSIKTPGIYINELNAFPNSVVSVATAVPIFIGYTEKAVYNQKSLIGVPTEIKSLQDFQILFGEGFRHIYAIKNHTKTETRPVKVINNPETCELELTTPRYFLYDCMRWFFMNGGGRCYVLSLGEFGDGQTATINFDDIKKQEVFDRLEKEMEPTLIVLPDFAQTSLREKCYALYNDVLLHCRKMQNRMGIFDVIQLEQESLQETATVFRNAIGPEGLNYGAAYYPWMNTAVVGMDEIDFTNIAINVEDLQHLLPEQIVAGIYAQWKAGTLSDSEADKKKKHRLLHNALYTDSPTYKSLIEAIRRSLNLLPPSAAIAGIYNMIDQQYGVWKAPANFAIMQTISPAAQISNDEHLGLNVDTVGGKSINAIRSFEGKGNLVWGARTLDGNSQDWRYINVRRTMIMIEQSVKLAMKAYSFEPNDSNTWVTIKSSIDSYLTNIWKQGALSGSKPDEAFGVDIGPGRTMTNDDIINGKLIVQIRVAMLRPAEFIVLTFEQQQQKS
jgi:phage tail sheath protein FI